MNTNLPPFYPNQKIVAKHNNDTYYKKGDEFLAKRMINAFCKCETWLVDIGATTTGTIYSFCPKCDIKKELGGSTCWFAATDFTPIEQTFQSISFEKVVEIESPLIGIN